MKLIATWKIQVPVGLTFSVSKIVEKHASYYLFRLFKLIK